MDTSIPTPAFPQLTRILPPIKNVLFIVCIVRMRGERESARAHTQDNNGRCECVCGLCVCVCVCVCVIERASLLPPTLPPIHHRPPYVAFSLAGALSQISLAHIHVPFLFLHPPLPSNPSRTHIHIQGGGMEGDGSSERQSICVYSGRTHGVTEREREREREATPAWHVQRRRVNQIE